MSIQGYKALVKAESSQVAFTDEATTTSDDQNYQITNAVKRTWGYNSTIVVEDAAVPTTEEYSINGVDGIISFKTVDVGRTITVTGDYVLLTTVAQAKAWSLDAAIDMLDNTVFQSVNRTFEPGLISGTATIGKFYDIDKYFIDMLFNGDTKVIELYADNTLDPIKAYANVSADSISVPVESLIEESISLQLTRKFVMGV